MIADNFSNIVLSSSGKYLGAFIGCIKYLSERRILDNIKNYVGCSGGALILFLLVLGYTHEEMIDIISNIYTCIDELQDVSAWNIVNFVENFGLLDNKDNKAFIIEVLNKKGFDENATLLDVVKKTGKNLILCVCNITKQQPEYFSVDNTPEVPIVTALIMTSALPFFYKPVLYNGDYYLDGAVMDNLPYKFLKYDSLNRTNTIIISLCHFDTASFDINEMNVLEYIKFICYMYCNNNVNMSNPDESDFPYFVKIHCTKHVFSDQADYEEFIKRSIDESYEAIKLKFEAVTE